MNIEASEYDVLEKLIANDQIKDVDCFFIGFHKFESDSKILSYMFYKIYGFGLAIGFTTLLYIHLHWPWPKEIMLTLSITLILISVLLGIRERLGANNNHIDWKYFLRILIALIPLIYVIMQNYN